MNPACALVALLSALPALAVALAPAPFYRPTKTSSVEIAPNVTLEVETVGRARHRRVIVDAEVCLREGPLEHLLTRSKGKVHEAILSADVDARDLHKALLLAGAVPGGPARLGGRFAPATGDRVGISLEWTEKGRTKKADAGEWLRDVTGKQAVPRHWVFAGSRLEPNADPKLPPRYLANDGDVICVANFETAMLDVPDRSSASAADLRYEANTANVPALGTRVRVVLTPGR